MNRNGLKKARPIYSPTVYVPVAIARSLCGNHVATTRLLVGKHGASETPRPRRNANSAPMPCTKPCASVHRDQKVIDRKYVTLLPKRSRNRPPGICAAT